jgi:1-deoxy-D-xylulose-5-phosphate synthase
MILDIVNDHKLIITMEEGVLNGGFGSSVSSFLHDNNISIKLYRMGIPDKYIDHGTREELLEDVGLSVSNLISIIKNIK